MISELHWNVSDFQLPQLKNLRNLIERTILFLKKLQKETVTQHFDRTSTQKVLIFHILFTLTNPHNPSSYLSQMHVRFPLLDPVRTTLS